MPEWEAFDFRKLKKKWVLCPYLKNGQDFGVFIGISYSATF